MKEKIIVNKYQHPDETSDDESFIKHHNNIINHGSRNNNNKNNINAVTTTSLSNNINNNNISTIEMEIIDVVNSNNKKDKKKHETTEKSDHEENINNDTYSTPTKTKTRKRMINELITNDTFSTPTTRKRMIKEKKELTEDTSDSEKTLQLESLNDDDDIPLCQMKKKYISPSSLKQSIINDKGKVIITKEKIENKKRKIERRKKDVKTGLTQTMTQIYPRIKKNNQKPNIKKPINKYKNIITQYNTKHENDFDIPAFDGAPNEEITTDNPDINLDENEEDTITEIVNVRKGKGYKLELMGKYNTGQILWFYIHPAWKEFTEFIDEFMT